MHGNPWFLRATLVIVSLTMGLSILALIANLIGVNHGMTRYEIGLSVIPYLCAVAFLDLGILHFEVHESLRIARPVVSGLAIVVVGVVLYASW